MAIQEGLVLDGLDLNAAAGPLRTLEADFTPPGPRYQWATSADTEGSQLVSDPPHENREITLKLAVDTQATTDLFLAQIAGVRDKLRRASFYPSGVALVWTPADGTKTCTFDVIAGEVTGLPIDWEGGWFAKSPTFTIKLTAKPYWRGSESGTSTATSGTTPFAALEVPNVTGDVPAMGRLLITDSASQNRRHVEWGAEGPRTYNSGTSLMIESDNLVTSGFGGTQATTWAGAYDVGGGNTQVTATVYTGITAIAGTGNLTHAGTFRVKARIVCAAATFGQPTTPRGIRLAWQANDGPFAVNDWAVPHDEGVAALTWQEVDLGLVTIPQPVTGAQRWTGRVEAYGNRTGISYSIDYLVLIPAGDGYGIAVAGNPDPSGVVVGADSFIGTSSGLGLNTRAAPSGGTWATSGDATDFVFEDNFNIGASDGIENVKRQTNAVETVGRYAILGTTNFTDTRVDCRVVFVGDNLRAEQALVARWTDANNHLRFAFPEAGSGRLLRIEQVVAGAVTVIASATSNRPAAVDAYTPPVRVRLVAYASGRVFAYLFDDNGATIATLAGSSTALATGGTLASGETGLRDLSFAVGGVQVRYYTEFVSTVPNPEPFVLYSTRSMQIRYDQVFRHDSTNTYVGPPQSYEGDRFYLQPGTSRVFVKARRNNVATATDANVTDNTTIQVFWTPRGLVVPR